MISVRQVLTFFATTTLLFGCASIKTEQSDSRDIVSNSVMVTNVASNSGGSGTVLLSTESVSLVLTNSHVCKLIEVGGLVHGPAGTFMVSAYKHSKQHDLCLIKVGGNLKASATISKTAPVPFYGQASISGHPSLYPTVVTNGHFSGRKVVSIMVGVSPCTAADIEDPAKAFICAMIGGLPIVKTYDSTLVTATIMPGSSGSGVFNDKNELSGVAFAGSGELGYAITVPYEYVRNFLYREAKTLKYSLPSNTIDLFQEGSRGFSESKVVQKLKNICKSAEKAKLEELCQLVNSDLVY